MSRLPHSASAASRRQPRSAAGTPAVTARTPARDRASGSSGPILQATGLTKHYGGVVANAGIDFTVDQGELRGIIGPNGAGKTTFFKMLTCEVPPTSGKIVFEGRDITGMSVTDVCQLGLTKSYQVNQLFNRLTVRENLTIAALAELRGKFRLDLLASIVEDSAAWKSRSSTRCELVNLADRRDTPVSQLAYGEKRRLEVGLALASSPTLLLLDEPLAGMSPRERVETVKLLKSIRSGPHDDHHRSRHGFAVRAGGTHHGAAGRPRAGRRHAGRDQGQRQGAGSVPRRRARSDPKHEPARGQGAQQLLRGFAHPLRRIACASSATRSSRCWDETAPGRARPSKA